MTKLRDKLGLEFIIQDWTQLRLKVQRCDAEIKDQPAGWRARRGYGKNCQRHAIYTFNGKRLCRIHAGAAILDHLMADHPTHFYRLANQPSVMKKPTSE